MRIFITGGTGLIGQRLVLDRLERGDRVVILSRCGARAAKRFAAHANPNVEVVEGNVAAPGPWQKAVDGCDAVVHLAGAGISDHRWTEEYKLEIAESRIDSTFQVVEAMAQAKVRPSVLVSGSAVGYYGECGDEEIDESHEPGDDFLARIALQWEGQAMRAKQLGVRVVRLRTGVVLDWRDGALPELVRPFQFFLGGPIGSGKQFMSWVHWRDLIGIIAHALRDKRVEGAVNGTAPNPVRNKDMAKAIGAALGRPAFFPVPKFALRIVLGEVTDAITMSQRALPKKALAAGYEFLYPEADEAVSSLLNRRTGDEPASADALAQRASAPAPQPSAPTPAPTAAPARPATPAAPAQPTKPIRLLALPVDGALMRSDGTIAPGDVQAIRAAERAGCTVILATSRPPRAVRPIVQTLGVAGPVITLNGALIWNHLDNLPLHHQGIDNELAKEIITAVREVDPTCPIVLEIHDSWFTDDVDADAMWLPGRMRAADKVGPLTSFLDDPVTRMSIGGTEAAVARVLPVLREKFWKTRRVALFQLESNVVQLTDPRVDKAVALQRVAMRLGLQRDEVMAIGDSRIDSGMIEWAGFSVAMENADQAVRELAQAVVPSNDETGVARAIQRYVISGR